MKIINTEDTTLSTRECKSVILTGGQVHDSAAAVALLKGIKLKGKKILAEFHD